MSDELKPRPFCGSEAVTNEPFDPLFSVICNSCGASSVFSDEETAEKRWNTRAAVTPEQFAMAVHDGRAWMAMRTCENLLDDHPCDFECSKCGFSVSTVPEGAADWQTTSWSYCPNCGAKVVE